MHRGCKNTHAFWPNSHIHHNNFISPHKANWKLRLQQKGLAFTGLLPQLCLDGSLLTNIVYERTHVCCWKTFVDVYSDHQKWWECKMCAKLARELLSRGRPIIGADIKHFTDIGHFQNRFADNCFFVFFIMQTNILFTGDIIYWWISNTGEII